MAATLSGFVPRGPANLHELGVAGRRAAKARAEEAARLERERIERDARRRERLHERDPRVRAYRQAQRSRKAQFAKRFAAAQREYDAFIAEQDRHFRGGRPPKSRTV